MSNTPAAAASSSSKSKAAGTSQPQEKRKTLFQKELQHMMYGFGDEQNVSRYPLHYYFVAI
jgi:transcription initiation factor TFIID subunit 13